MWDLLEFAKKILNILGIILYYVINKLCLMVTIFYIFDDDSSAMVTNIGVDHLLFEWWNKERLITLSVQINSPLSTLLVSLVNE